MAQTVECVPNFSEGQKKEVIEAIANAVAMTEGCNLLDVDPGLSTNRTVYTFVGPPAAVVEGALNAARTAYQHINMAAHQGEHPRLGALDVCPFIPVSNVTMADCVECAKEFGERLAAELGVPVYLYGAAAGEEHRTTVPQIRSGEYEGLCDKLKKTEWKPDFGPCDFVPNWGATMAGARKFLIAYNINMLSTKEQAHRIALNIREQGRSKEEPGRLKAVQAIGWFLEEANMAQVSANITDFEVTPIHQVYEEVEKDAKDLNLAVCGSQIVGVVPLKAFMDIADYYMEKQNLFILEEDQKIRLVVKELGLNTLGLFVPEERIIEYMIADSRDGPLAELGVKKFVQAVGARSATPGGGSVAALVGSLGAALSTMVGYLTYGNKKFAELDSQIRKLLPSLHSAMKEIVPYIDADTTAYNQYSAAAKLPHSTEEEENFRDIAMQRCLLNAISVPMSVAQTANSCWTSLKELAKIGNLQCKSDLQVGARCLETAVWGAYYNVMINVKDLKDDETKAKVLSDAEEEIKVAQEGCKETLKIIEERE